MTTRPCDGIGQEALTPPTALSRRTTWEVRAANLLKAELKRKGVTYAQLVEKLADIGISEKEVNVANKLSRGKFSAAFLLQCLEAVGSSQLRLD